MNPWTLATTDPLRGDLYLTNGYMGTTMPATTFIARRLEEVASYIRGVYNDTGYGGIDRLARLPDWDQLAYNRPSTIREYRRELDLRHGLVHTRLVLEEARGALTLENVLFLSRADPHSAASRTEIRADFDGEIEFSAALEAAPSQVEVIDRGATESSIWMQVRTRKYGVSVATAIATVEDAWRREETAGEGGVARRLRTEVKAGQPVTLTQIAQIATSLDAPDPIARVMKPLPPFDALRAEHELAWGRLWATDIEIEGDPETQQFIRAALYYLWSTVREGDRWSIAPMGLSSNGYNGHIFWDAELWMYPSLLVTHPDIARSCLTYREHTIDAAHARARSGGYDGARFPWEGGFTGEEMTPTWAEPRELQIHITADVALAQWWYFLTTNDMTWLREHGFPIMRECAAFWLSRVEYNDERTQYEIRDVQCADEYAVGVNNDAFTNASVRLCLLTTAQAAELLGEPVNDAWRTVAEGMHIPYDRDTSRHLVYDGYAGQVTKQADVELLAYPLEYVTDGEQIARDLDYYHGVIDSNGPAMSYSVYAVISAQLGRADDAYHYLQKSYRPNTRPPFWSFSETPTNDEFYFCTGIGGALQAVLFGFTGLRLRDGHFVLGPILPDRWPRLCLRNLFIQGHRTDLELTPGSLKLCRHTQVASLTAEVHRVDQGAVLRVSCDAGGSVRPDVRIGDAGGLNWRGAKEALDEGASLPDNWGDGVRVGVRLGDAEVLHVLLRRLP